MRRRGESGEPARADGFAEALDLATSVAGPDARRVRGWATVELDRAEGEVSTGNVVRSRDVPNDPLLGARSRLLEIEEKDDLLLLEPATEGRLAASLARFGEGPLVLYLVAPATHFGAVVAALVDAGYGLSGEGTGPFGLQRLVLGGPEWGAHLVIAEDAPIPPAPGAATIER